jgi:SulP family sulfate permease
MHFANAPRAVERLQELVQTAEPHVIILECSAIPDFEYTALKMLTESEKNLRRRGITLWLAGLNPEPLQRIRRSPLGQTLGDERMFPNLRRAVRAYLEYDAVTHKE